jgi:hypothetical protein
MVNGPTELFDGVDLTATDFVSRRTDVAFFVNAGNTAFVTINGKRRFALVPVEIGEDHLARHQAEAAAADEAGTDDSPGGQLHEIHGPRTGAAFESVPTGTTNNA